MNKAIDISHCSRVHFVGIGGCSMSGLAMMFKSKGMYVQGSDSKHSPFTDGLLEESVPVFFGHSAENVVGCDLLVYSAAIKPDNVERVYARAHGIPELERCDALGALSRGYGHVVGISGCHGKTTITSMLALITERAKLDATVHVGGYVDFLHGGTRIAGHSMFITEACEYVESFLSLTPTTIVMNNIDDDHLDYFKDIDHIVSAFEKFVALLPSNGYLIACTDDVRVKKIYEAFPGSKISYGTSDADITPANITYNELGHPSFDIMKHGKLVCHIELNNLIGDFNIQNALAAAACAIHIGASTEAISSALKEFRATKRRFEYYGLMDGKAQVYHDYAHHPGEIAAVLSGADKCPHSKLYVVFQCNSYSRAKTLFTGDMSFFAPADMVLVPDIYPGRETDDGTVHARDMVRALNCSGVNASYLPTFEKINAFLRANVSEGDLILTLGSGDVYEKTKLFLN